ncbi:MAG: XrtA/PEP-CTERM system histidine kinase PrsK [Vicinamibacteria bacterium]
MRFETSLAYLSAAVALTLALTVLWREPRRLAYRAFAAGMVVFACRELLAGFALAALYEAEIVRWHRLRLVADSFVPGCWLVFALTFARAHHDQFLERWRPVWIAAFAVPVALAIGGWDWLVVRSSPYPFPRWLVPVGSTGFWLHVVFLLATVLVLMNLESTLRASRGSVRWQIKFTVIGLAALFGVQLFIYSQVLLYSSIQTTLFPFASGALLLASGLIVVSLKRSRLFSFDVYPSERLLYNSLTLLVVGVYLLVVAGLVRSIDAIAGTRRAPLVAFVFLVAIVVLVMGLLSTELQQKVKRFVNLNLARPSYDYRRLWDTFTRRTSSAVEIEPLCAAIASMVAETFGCSASTIWLANEGEKKLTLGGSTAVSADEAASILRAHSGGRALFALLGSRGREPFGLRDTGASAEGESFFRAIEASYAVALSSADDVTIGFLTLNERVAGNLFDVEDLSLLATFGDQAAAALSNRRLSRELQRAREMETFQALSAFFVHDLKNLASRLSLAMQNLPSHYDKPAFQKDLFETMSKSVAKIDGMTSRLSSLTKGLELKRVECDLNRLVRDTLQGLEGGRKASLSEELGEIPSVVVDPEQIQKVLTNLVLNALEATGENGRIRVSTRSDNGWVTIAVEDDGCGMSPEFVSRHLFKPFQTTKKQGLGIGLYHSKAIVEGHGGRIEVDSERGRGSIFRVRLPSREARHED